MICKNCPEGRRYAEGSRYCVLYGIYIGENHECSRKGGQMHENDVPAGDDRNIREETGLSEDGWDAVDRLQGIL